MCVFGEVVIAKPEGYHKNTSWKPCIWVGRSTRTDRTLVLEAGGAHEVRTVRGVARCWRPEVVQISRGTPYDFKGGAMKTTFLGSQPTRVPVTEQAANGDEAASDPESLVEEQKPATIAEEVALDLSVLDKATLVIPGRVPPPASAAVAGPYVPDKPQPVPSAPQGNFANAHHADCRNSRKLVVIETLGDNRSR